MWKKESLRRKTFHNFSSRKAHSDEISRIVSFGESVEDHIYEEIDEEDHDNHYSAKETEEYPFLTLISSERRKNLKFYGCADWDFGTNIKK